MDQVVLKSLPYHKGFLALTGTHLLVARGEYLVESLALEHLSDIVVEQAHSFRHRGLGLATGAALLALGVGCGSDVVLLAMFRGKGGLGAFFAVGFGLLFLFSVVTSRRIWWMRVRYAKTLNLIPLAGVEPEALEQFAGNLSDAVRGAG